MDVGKIAAYGNRAGEIRTLLYVCLARWQGFFSARLRLFKCEFAEGVNGCVEEYDPVRQR